jgi:UDP-N-acetylglucosamine 2-epimerase (hydrolysing)
MKVFWERLQRRISRRTVKSGGTKLIKKIVFLTGTRADFGKLKALINRVEESPDFECHVFVTGMHMVKKYGETVNEIKKHNYRNIHTFKNQSTDSNMKEALWKTIKGFGKFIEELQPDMIVVHGDRVEALGGATVGALENILVAHIEGGELSGTIDELIRHAITKMSHVHFVANEEAKRRVTQLGEREDSIFVIGSPDIDIMLSENLPDLEEVKKRYEIPFDEYAIFCYHPVTTEINGLDKDIDIVVETLRESKNNYVVIYPNNDKGSEIIINHIKKLKGRKKFRVLPSMRFEYYLALLRNAQFIIGNSSAGIREAGTYGIPSINIGSRQNNRCKHEGILNVGHQKGEILDAIKRSRKVVVEKNENFGDGRSAERFMRIINGQKIWRTPNQKQFVDFKGKV